MYSEDFFENFDVDWFSVNENKNVAHFAAGGCGFIPNAIKKSYSLVEALFDYIDKLDDVSEVTIVKKNIPKLHSEKYINRYLYSFNKMASKGIYAYDVSDMNGINQAYSLIAFPKSPITYVDFPENLQRVLSLSLITGTGFADRLYPNDW